jgi:hypothetical protein
MSTGKKRIGRPSNEQLALPLFESLAAEDPGSADISTRLRAAITAAIKRCPLSRWQIAGRMSELLDRETTKAQLDSWTAGSKDGWRFPAEYLVAFCRAVDDYAVLQLIAAACGHTVVHNRDHVRLELGRVLAEEQRLRERKRELLKLQAEEPQAEGGLA